MGYTNAPKDASPSEKEKYKGAIKTVHRLDRQTSGIVFFGKNEDASNIFRELMLKNEISKVYFARIRGNFENCKGIKNGELTITNYTYCVSHIDAIWECCEKKDVPFEHQHKAKDSTTRFKFKFYDKASDMSVIKCYP